jgi:two-component sensor histidine kinase
VPGGPVDDEVEAFQTMTDQSGDAHACHGGTGAIPRHLQLTVSGCGRPVRLSRQVTHEVLVAWRLAHVAETAVLLVSELVTNAVRHVRSTDTITLELEAAPTCLRIEVYRCRPGLTAPRNQGEFDESGFGSALVDSLADRWGIRETMTGKTVWAELDVRGESGPPAD